jgi:hypothetical protein
MIATHTSPRALASRSRRVGDERLSDQLARWLTADGDRTLGRDAVWLPRRWRNVRFVGEKRERLVERLVKLVRWFERWSRPRGRFPFGHRVGNVGFGALVLVGSFAAFVAPPFSWLDTLPALGVVLLSLGILLADAFVVAAGLVVGAAGIALVAVLGRAALRGLGGI